MAPHASQSPARETPARSAPVISIVNADASAANAIKDALESALQDAEKAEMAAPPEPKPIAEAPAPTEPEPAAEESAPVEPEPKAEEPAPVEPEPKAEKPAPVEPEPKAEKPAPVEPELAAQEPVPPEPDYASYNIMELLVEEAVDRYIRMFGLCDCPRCRADVVAEALTNLIPKYVVMGKAESNPRLAIYRSRYSAAVTAQILRACKVVMDDPRH